MWFDVMHTGAGADVGPDGANRIGEFYETEDAAVEVGSSFIKQVGREHGAFLVGQVGGPVVGRYELVGGEIVRNY